MMRPIKLLWCGLIGLATSVYAASFFWPVYDWDLRLPSPDGKYDLIVLRGDAAAFDDFTYSLYIFPHQSTPKDRAKASRVWLTRIWRGSAYLVYSGYDYPMFRWTGSSSIEVDLDEANYTPFEFNPIKFFPGAEKPIVISLRFDTQNDDNTMP